MCARARALSVAGMRPSLLPGLTAAVVTAAVLAVSPPALAADAVYGGTTSRGGDPIVLKADSAATTLRKLAVSWDAPCSDGGILPRPVRAHAGRNRPSASPPARRSCWSPRTRRGASRACSSSATTSGRTSPPSRSRSRASSSPRAPRARSRRSSRSPTRRPATRSPRARPARSAGPPPATPGSSTAARRARASRSSLRLDQQRKRVNDLMFAWRAGCTPSNLFFRFAEHFGGFPVKGSGAFGNPISDDYQLPDGAASATSPTRSPAVWASPRSRAPCRSRSPTATPPARQVDGCDSGTVTWKAATGLGAPRSGQPPANAGGSQFRPRRAVPPGSPAANRRLARVSRGA